MTVNILIYYEIHRINTLQHGNISSNTRKLEKNYRLQKITSFHIETKRLQSGESVPHP